MPHEPQTEALHKEMLILLKDFHNFCMENDIKYSLHGGTLLGAIREKGFIPWDDDVDITLTRNEFEKLMFIIKNADELTFKYIYVNGVYKLIRQNENGDYAWIDILLYDYISERIICQKIKLFNLTFLKAWTKSTKDLKVTKAHNLYRGTKYYLIYFVHFLGLPFTEKFKQKISDIVYKSFSGKKELIHRSNDQYVAIKIILPKSAMENYIMTDFEDTQLMITSDYDLVLKTSYGDDYMIPKKFDNDMESHIAFRTLNS